MSGGRRLRSVVPGRLLIVAASALTMLTAACGSRAPARHAALAAARASPPIKHRHPMAAAADITLAFAGDVHFAGRVARLLSDPATTFGSITSVL